MGTVIAVKSLTTMVVGTKRSLNGRINLYCCNKVVPLVLKIFSMLLAYLDGTT